MKPLLILFMAVTLLACNNNNTQAPSSSDATTVSTAIAPFKNVDVDSFKKLMQQENIVVLDVRTPEEIAEGKIEGAMEIDYRADDFKEEVAILDKNKTYLVYCRSGRRSSSSCELMSEMGFSDLYNLEGGYNSWIEE